ncbi:MAG TPA: hypothetical protein VGE52_16115 [Pirellulales bacterium]
MTFALGLFSRRNAMLAALLSALGCASSDPRDPLSKYTARHKAFREEIDELKLVGDDYDTARQKLLAEGYSEYRSGQSEDVRYFKRDDPISRKEMGTRNVTMSLASNKVAEVKTAYEASGGK